MVAEPFEGVLYSTVPPRLILRRDSKWFLLSLPSDRLLVTETEQRPSNFSLLRSSFAGRMDIRALEAHSSLPGAGSPNLPFLGNAAVLGLSDASRTPRMRQIRPSLPSDGQFDPNPPRVTVT